MRINKTDKFIEVIGHYDNEVQCAKMTLLADLYAIEHREGYAKFPIECEDKLRLVDKKLEFRGPVNPPPPGYGPFYNYFILNGITKTVQSCAARPIQEEVTHLYITYHNNNIYGAVAGEIQTTEYILTNGELILENVNPEYTGSFFENKHGSGTSEDPYYLVEDEVVHAGFFADFTTYHTEKSTQKVSVDLTTLSGWSSLSTGTHNITIVARADGYRDSEPSAAVSVTKGGAFKQVFPTTTSDNCTLLENLNQSKIYSIYTGNSGVFYLKYENGSWQITGVSWDSHIVTQTDNSVKIYFGSGRFSAYVSGITLEGDIEATNTDFEGFSSTPVYAVYTCIVEGTKITLSDGSTKLVQDIQYDDELLVWDFDNACLTSAKPLWIMKAHKATKYNHLVFSDGSTLDTVNQHRIFNLEKGMFTYPMTDDTPTGTTTFNDKGEYITLVSKEVIEGEVNYYNIITDYHMNLFAGTILTSCRLSNLYPIKDMRYVRDGRNIVPYEEFNNIPIEYYYGLRLGEQPTDINRDGAVSFGDTSVEDYVRRLINIRKE